MFTRAAGLFHEKHETFKGKGAQENQRLRQALFDMKSSGKWEICRHMGTPEVAPTIAVRRPERGPGGQPNGTFATSTTEIDEICRKIYGKIYKCSADDAER